MRAEKKSAAPRPPKHPQPPSRLEWRHGAFFVLGMLATFFVYLMVSAKGHSSLTAGARLARIKTRQSAPWGQLEYTTLQLERPDESLPMPPPPPVPIHWFFEGLSPIQVESLFNTSDLTAPQKRQLLDRTRWLVLSNGCAVLPPLEVVRDMSPSARKTLYAVLQKSPENTFHRAPVRIAAERFEAWLAASGLPADKQGLIRKVALVEGETIDFYDTPLLDWLCSPEERRRLAKAVSQIPALLMQLHVRPDSDIDALAAYWGGGRRSRAMKPFLESLARVPGGNTINVSFFFPPLPRMKLYTYPDPLSDQLAERQDCYWTAMNFFNETPDNRFFDPEFTQKILRTDYAVVRTNWSFGDVIMLVDDRDNAVHMCVYVADDVVFTKNGAAAIRPWVLMRLPAMIAEYAGDRPMHCVVFRHKAG